jgi:hypothetical protein
MVYFERFGSNPLTIPLKYLWQAVATIRLIRRERAAVAFVMTPPVFAGVTLMLYSLVWPLRYVVDVHTAALLMPRWRHWQWLQALVCRRAMTTLITNDRLAAIVKRCDGHTTLVRDVPVQYPCSNTFAQMNQFTVAVICSFNYDEPIDEIFKAATELPEVQFLFTGDHSALSADRKAGCSGNVRFTGFLENADYGSLLTHSHAVMSLTTRDHTMLRGAYEAIYVGTPVVISGWPILREAFDTGAVHVESNAADIVRGIRVLRDDLPRLRREASELRLRKLDIWSATRQEILARLK